MYQIRQMEVREQLVAAGSLIPAFGLKDPTQDIEDSSK